MLAVKQLQMRVNTCEWHAHICERHQILNWQSVPYVRTMNDDKNYKLSEQFFFLYFSGPQRLFVAHERCDYDDDNDEQKLFDRARD